DGQRDLAINEIIIEGDARGILAGVAVKDAAQARPIHRAQTHRTRLATGVEIAIIELEGLEPPAGVANGDDLGVGSRVVAGSDLVAAAPDDFVSFDDDGAEGSAHAAAHHLDREPDGLAHECPLHLNSSPTFSEQETILPRSRTFSTWSCRHF